MIAASGLVVVGVWVVGGAIALVALGFVLKGVVKSATASAMADPATAGAITAAPALMGGIAAPGFGRTRGNGVLALHPDRLTFVLAVPRRVITVPIAAVTEVEVARTLKLPGKFTAGAGSWLMVRWSNTSDTDLAGDGTAGFLVADPERWAQAIRRNDWRDTNE
jgi:hypothetical protein